MQTFTCTYSAHHDEHDGEARVMEREDRGQVDECATRVERRGDRHRTCMRRHRSPHPAHLIPALTPQQHVAERDVYVRMVRRRCELDRLIDERAKTAVAKLKQQRFHTYESSWTINGEFFSLTSKLLLCSSLSPNFRSTQFNFPDSVHDAPCCTVILRSNFIRLRN